MSNIKYHQNITSSRIDGVFTTLENEKTLPLPCPSKVATNQHFFNDPLTSILWQLMMLSGVFIYGSHSILINLCKVDGKIPFNSAAVVLLIELAKLLFSLFFFIPEVLSGKAVKNLSIKTILAFSIPAILYCINNNICVYVQLFLDPASYQVMSNFKIASTAILYRLIIKRKISQQRWLSLFLITVAGISNSYGGLHHHHEILTNRKAPSEIYVSLVGVFLMILYCTISGIAGVYTEYILKRQYQISLHLQNSLLYTYGVVFNFWAFLAQHIPSIHSSPDESGTATVVDGFFSGFSLWTLLIIITQAANGLIMSAVMKHASNITRLIIIACAMLVTTFLSVLLFSLQLNIYFIFAFTLVVIALKFYHT